VLPATARPVASRTAQHDPDDQYDDADGDRDGEALHARSHQQQISPSMISSYGFVVDLMVGSA